jgi:glycine dehydrogenase subunit 2
MKHMTRKATRHVNQNEGLIFEKSSAGKAAWKLPPLDVPEVDTTKLLGKAERKDLGNMPEVSEIEIIRHFTRLSTWNYAIDLGMYPLGSCTMKYNPRVNEAVARAEGIANGHPYQPERISQGALRIMKTLSDCLIEITGMDAITLQPAAGAHGEMTGLLMVRAYHQSQGNARKKILIPDSAHGTNPATAAMVNYAVENLKSDSRGMVDLASLKQQMNEDVAALMLTNPNTLGVFEQQIHEIADILHAKGGLLYMDGANMNALVGKVRPGDFGVDVLDATWRRRPWIGSGCREEAVRAVLARARSSHQARWHSRFRIQPPALRRTCARVLWQLWNVCARPGVHSGERP